MLDRMWTGSHLRTSAKGCSSISDHRATSTWADTFEERQVEQISSEVGTTSMQC